MAKLFLLKVPFLSASLSTYLSLPLSLPHSLSLSICPSISSLCCSSVSLSALCSHTVFFCFQAAKPLAVLAVGTYGAYGLYEWNRANVALGMNGKSQQELYDLFDKIDQDRSGSIELNELDQALKKSNVKFTKGQIRAMMKRADVDEDGHISREEFLNICEEMQSSAHVPSVTTDATKTHFEDITKKKG
jgi:hypothetical protein